MGGGGSKWRKAAVGPPLPAASQRESVCSEEGAGGEGLQRWEGDWPPVVQRQAGRAAAASGDWTLQAGGGSSRRPQPSPWRLPKAPCGDCTPSIQCLSGGQDGGSNSNRSPDNPRPPRAAGAGACAWPSTLSGCSLGLGNSRRSPGSAHGVFMIKTRHVENNNLANGFQMSGKNMPSNLTPILYDYSEEELMASIEKEYS